MYKRRIAELKENKEIKNKQIKSACNFLIIDCKVIIKDVVGKLFAARFASGDFG